MRECNILLISFAVTGIRFAFGKVFGIASVRYFVASSVLNILVSLFIFSIIAKE
jgi:hypothetical protein